MNQRTVSGGPTGMQYRRGSTSERIEPRQIYDGKGKIRTWDPFNDISQLPTKMSIWELEPGTSEGNHVHDEDDTGDNGNLEEIYYFVSGNGTMWSDGTEVPVAAGDAVLAPPGSDHGIRNIGTEPMKLVIIWGKPAK